MPDEPNDTEMLDWLIQRVMVIDTRLGQYQLRASAGGPAFGNDGRQAIRAAMAKEKHNAG